MRLTDEDRAAVKRALSKRLNRMDQDPLWTASVVLGCMVICAAILAVSILVNVFSR